MAIRFFATLAFLFLTGMAIFVFFAHPPITQVWQTAMVACWGSLFSLAALGALYVVVTGRDPL